MYSFFQDPRNGYNARRRQDRQDFFPSFSDSLLFDPFLGGHNNGLSEADDRLSKQRQQRQRQWLQEQQQQQYQRELEEQQYEQEQQRLQEQYELERQQQLLQEQQLAQEEMRRRANTEGRVSGRQQQRQHPQRSKDRHEHSEALHGAQAFERQHPQYHTQQQRPQHQPQSHQHQHWRGGQQGHGSKRRGRRQRRRGVQEPVADETTSDQADQAEETESADAACEHEDTAEEHSHSFKAQPTRKASQSSASEESEEHEEPEEPEEQDDDEEDETAVSEEDEPLPCDKELQRKSQAELQQIDTSLGELSHELDQILAGQITNKKQILMTEENLTKAMLKIDAVESGGDDGIRKKRKELINRAEQLLVKVDEFKRRTKTSVFGPNH